MTPVFTCAPKHESPFDQSDLATTAGRVLLISCYESGLQPLNLAQPKAVLEHRGFAVDVLDLSVQTLAELPTEPPNAIAVSVPMQTALRLAVSAVSALRSRWPEIPIAFYGLYAGLNARYLLETDTADHVLAGESELALAEWCEQATGSQACPPTAAEIPLQELSLRTRLDLPQPDRHGLPDLERYARFQAADGSLHTAGQVAASRGCLHTCRHCPVVPIYRGRFFIRDLKSVTGDIRQQVEAGAGHISFVDPDFLNGPGHALKVTEWLHRTYPEVTFDFTAKVEHLLGRARHLAALKANGAVFVVSAFEAVSDDILERLDKGHTVRDMERVLPLLAELGLPIHPTWLPFTPWTSRRDYLDMLDWIEGHGLVNAVPPVQLALRLLIPPHSRLLDSNRGAPWLERLEPAEFQWRWHHPDPGMDALQVQVERLVADRSDWSGERLFRQVRTLAEDTDERPLGPQLPPPPRLTEDWFC
ncbi:MAG: radical SAM protein [Caldilineaceae bacterium SB0665_bin_21]|nr:radical SAM protein [Caldilineaceae bacterium SB0665_bin_21]MYA04747.1 radical SAM protein [Caldilineaceae bacterium SB0664_bin_22]